MARAILGTATYSSGNDTAPIRFDLVPENVRGKPTRITAIGLEVNADITSGTAAIGLVGLYRIIESLNIKCGTRQANRDLVRGGPLWRLRDWYCFVFGRLATIDAATIAASTANAVRRVCVVIPCRGNPKKWRRPKDFDVPSWAMRRGGTVVATWGTATQIRNSVAGTDPTVNSATLTVWAEYEIEESGDAELPTPWTLNYVETAENTVPLPKEDLPYLAMQNADRDHSDNTTVHVDGFINNTGFAVLAHEFNRRVSEDVTAGSGAVTPATPEWLPLLYPDDSSKLIDVPDAIPSPQLTRTSTDAQRLSYMRLLDKRAYLEGLAEAFNLDAAEVRKAKAYKHKFSAKNADKVKFTPERAAKALRLMPVKIDPFVLAPGAREGFGG